MKYIKKFENKDTLQKLSLQNLKKKIEYYLAYLFDEGFEYKLNIKQFNKFGIAINNITANDDSWSDMENYIIPFLEILTNEYKITSIRFHCHNGEHWLPIKYYTIHEIINNDNIIINDIMNISIDLIEL